MGANLGDLEDLADFGVAQDLLAELRSEHALGGLLEIVHDVVDDLVGTDLDALLLGEAAGLAGRNDVEADDDRLGRVGQEHVALGDAADRGLEHTDLDLGGADLLALVLEHVERALLGGLDDDADLLDVGVGHLREHAVERDLGLGQFGLALAVAALLGGFHRLLQRVHDVELIAGVGHLVDAGDLHRHRGRGLADALAAVVGDVADATEAAAGDDVVTDLELALLDEDVGDGAAALFGAGLDDRAAGGAAEVGLELEELGLVVQGLEQFLDAHAGGGGCLDDFDVAAPFHGVQIVLGQASQDLLHLGLGGVGAIDLVERPRSAPWRPSRG